MPDRHGSIILDRAVVQKHVLLGAGSLVPEGRVLESGHLYLGRPAKLVRALTEEEIAYFSYSAEHYVALARHIYLDPFYEIHQTPADCRCRARHSGALAYALMEKPQAPAATFATLDGRSIVLDDLRGKVVLVNFWATSCPAVSRKCQAWSKPIINTKAEVSKSSRWR